MKKLVFVFTLSLILTVILPCNSSVVFADTRAPRPAPPVQNITITATVSSRISPQGALPDLVVEEITTEPLTVLKGFTVTITIVINNQGNVGVGSTDTFYTDLLIDPVSPPAIFPILSDIDHSWECQGSWLPAHSSYTLNPIQMQFQQARTFNFWVIVDSDDFVLEDDEDNNIYGPIPIQVIPSNWHSFDTHQQMQKLAVSNADLSELSDSRNDIYPKGLHLRYSTAFLPYVDWARDPSMLGIETAELDSGEWQAHLPVSLTNKSASELQAEGTYTELLRFLDSEPIPKTKVALSDYTDTSGVMRLGIFENDVAVSNRNYSPSTSPITDAHQMAPVMVMDPADSNRLYAVWQDERNGQWYNDNDPDCHLDNPPPGTCRYPEDNTDIYFAYSTDGGATWIEPPTSGDAGVHPRNPVNRDGQIIWQRAPDLAIAPDGSKVYAVWQDRRNGDYDIYFNVFDTVNLIWDPPGDTPDINILSQPETCNPVSGDQTAPSIDVDAVGNIYVVWVDARAGNDDIYFTMSRNGGATWGGWYDYASGGEGCVASSVRVNDFTNLVRQASPVVAVASWSSNGVDYDPWVRINESVTETVVYPFSPNPVVYVSWEDWRNGDADIYLSASIDVMDDQVIGGTHLPTFGIDELVPVETVENEQLAPDMIAYIKLSHEGFRCQFEDYSFSVNGPIWAATANLVWRDVAADGTSGIWYIDSHITDIDGWGANFPCFDESRLSKVSNDIDQQWHSTPPWHGDPTIATTPRHTGGIQGTDAYTESSTVNNVYVAWSDGRNYDDWNYDIYIAQRVWTFAELDDNFNFQGLVSMSNANSAWGGGYVVGWHILPEANIVVNDNVKVLNTTLYNRYLPAPAHQRRPSLVASWGRLYVMWDDDRNGLEPFWDRDVFFARSATTKYMPIAEWVSPALQAYGAFPWILVDWADSTDYNTDVQVQVRVSNNFENWYPYGCQAEDGWFGNHGKCGGWFDAPGQMIVRPGYTDAADHPIATHLQFRVRLRSFPETDWPFFNQKTPLISSVFVYYKDPQYLYLPLIMRHYGAP